MLDVCVSESDESVWADRNLVSKELLTKFIPKSSIFALPLLDVLALSK